ncbi:PREDICTED: transportin-3 [Nicrophorus vespilloides]|uniref:Transportin-3 n=1 Tax=Nicrophorus vespilloides TaxID=110193 RepID=A0ABM1N851_NICVS|nr:PREDICTED: transportin-3 [Nicrophorus vespilloides]
MEEKPNIEIVYMAISALYNNPNSTEKERASHWLRNFQKSVHAWTLADEILHHKKDLESCYFAAQTMRSKIHYYFHELPIEAHGSLRDSLMDHLSKITEGTNSIIVTQLCLALTDLILQMCSWEHAVLDLINRFSQSNLWPLLEIFIVLPEEIESRSLRLGENRRQHVMDDLRSCAPTVNNFLKHCSNMYCNNLHDNVQITSKIIRCYASWISIEAISLDDVTDHVVVTNSLMILSYKQENAKCLPVSNTLHDAATNAICTLLKRLEVNNNQQNIESYLCNHILELEVPYHLSVANEDIEKSMNYCRIFTELGETFLCKIIYQTTEQYQHQAIKVFDLILMCVGHHDYEVAAITFNLWFLLSEELCQKNSKLLIEMFRPYIERLVTALCRHCQMEPDLDGLLEDMDDFKDFRGKVSELVKDVVFIIGSASCFRYMFMNLQGNNVTWDITESALFIMQAVAKYIVPNENEVVPKVVEAILNIPPSTHIAVRYTSVLLVGELCEWIEKHPSTLDPILNFLVNCLSEPGIGPASATAIQNICAACNEHMSRHVPVMLQLLRQVDSFAITNDAVIGLLKGVAAIISKCDLDEVTPSLRDLCSLQVNPLSELVDNNIATVPKTKADPVLWLDRLSSIFRNLVIHVDNDVINPCKVVVLEVWPVMSKVLNKYASELRIMERSCRTVRFMLRCVSQQVKELLESLVGQSVSIYAMYKHSCFLYLGSILVDEYATDPTCVQGLLDMLEAFITPTFELLQEKEGLRNHPETVDDFFRLCARFLQRSPVPFLLSLTLPLIIQCGLMCCSLDHKEANISVMKFFFEIINTGKIARSHDDFPQRKQLVNTIVLEYGQQLVDNLVQASVFSLHPYMLSEVADVIVELLRYNRDLSSEWLAITLQGLPKEGTGTITVKQQQLTDVHASVVKSDTSKSVTYALKDLARLYR